MTLNVVLRYRTRRPWAPGPASLRRWARLAAGNRGGELGIRVVGSRESRALNERWRGRAKPTNVLSFPASPGPGSRQIGDLVVCAPVVAREAREQGKPVAAHWAHRAKKTMIETATGILYTFRPSGHAADWIAAVRLESSALTSPPRL